MPDSPMHTIGLVCHLFFEPEQRFHLRRNVLFRYLRDQLPFCSETIMPWRGCLIAGLSNCRLGLKLILPFLVLHSPSDSPPLNSLVLSKKSQALQRSVMQLQCLLSIPIL